MSYVQILVAPTAAAARQLAEAMGLHPDEVEALVAAGAPHRHRLRVEFVRSSMREGGFRPDEAAGMAWLECQVASRGADAPTDRLPPFRKCGKGRRHATDGPAWTAAIRDAFPAPDGEGETLFVIALATAFEVLFRALNGRRQVARVLRDAVATCSGWHAALTAKAFVRASVWARKAGCHGADFVATMAAAEELTQGDPPAGAVGNWWEETRLTPLGALQRGELLDYGLLPGHLALKPLNVLDSIETDGERERARIAEIRIDVVRAEERETPA